MAETTVPVITRYRGDLHVDCHQVWNNLTKLPQDITGFTAIRTVSRVDNPTDDTSKVFSTEGVILDSINGKFIFPVTVEGVAEIGEFFYDVQVADGDGLTTTTEKGKYNLIQDITKE